MFPAIKHVKGSIISSVIFLTIDMYSSNSNQSTTQHFDHFIRFFKRKEQATGYGER